MRSSHPTRERLIATMVELLDGDDPEHVTADEVLIKSGISKGSLYHHFEDYEDLVEAALVFRFHRNVDVTIEKLTHILGTSGSQQEFVAQLKELNLWAQNPERRPYRLERARAAGLTFSSPRFEKSLGIEQLRLTQAFADLFVEAQNKNWVRPELDPMAGAVFIQAYTLGRVVDDISPQKVSPSAWNSLVDDVVDRLFVIQ